jgi:heptosyltransferase-2
MTERSRTLVISPNWIGDAVMAEPLLQLLRRQHPQRPIDVLAPAWVAPVWRAMAAVDTVIEAPFRHGALQLAERWKFAGMLRQRGYADAYVLPNTLKFALIPWLAGIPQRVGYRGEMRYGLLNVMHHDDKNAPRAMVAFYAALAGKPAAVCTPVSALPKPALTVTAAQISAVMAQTGLRQDAPLVIFAPGSEFGSAKRWPTRHFAELAAMIRSARPAAQIVLLGSAKDRAVCDEIVASAPAVLSLAGTTSLTQAITLIAQADAIVSNDSGLLHIASALNRPLIAIYGPTDPDHAPPFSDVAASISLRLDCAPCRQRDCPLVHHDCMQKISADMVWRPLSPLLPATSISRS